MKTMEELRADYLARFALKEEEKRQKVVEENRDKAPAPDSELGALTLHASQELEKKTKGKLAAIPMAMTVGCGTEIRIGGVPHILVEPGKLAGTWYDTEGELIDVAEASDANIIDTVAHRENASDPEAVEVFEKVDWAKKAKVLSDAIRRHSSSQSMAGFIEKRQSRSALLPPTENEE